MAFGEADAKNAHSGVSIDTMGFSWFPLLTENDVTSHEKGDSGPQTLYETALDWKGSVEELERALRHPDASRRRREYVAFVLADAKRRRLAEDQLDAALNKILAILRRKGRTLSDPLVLDRIALELEITCEAVPAAEWPPLHAYAKKFRQATVDTAHIRFAHAMAGGPPETLPC